MTTQTPPLEQVESILGPRPDHGHNECHQLCPVYHYDLSVKAVEQLYIQGQQEMSKAYGGCRHCYGKGYATQKSEMRARGLRWDTSGIKFCECARGKQLELVIAAERLEELKQVKLYNELTRIGVEEVDRRIIELQQQIEAKES